MNSEIFFNLSNEQISIIIFDKDSKKQISNKIFNFSDLSTNNMSIEDGINHVLKKQAFQAIFFGTYQFLVKIPKM